MLTTDEARALAILTALVALGACLGWIDARHPRILALTLGDSLALGVPAGDPGAPGDPAPGGPAPAAVPPAEPGGASAAAPADSAAASPGDRGGAYTADGRLDLNRATAEELEGLPGVGPKTAERIVLDRRERGPFRSARDLGRV